MKIQNPIDTANVEFCRSLIILRLEKFKMQSDLFLCSASFYQDFAKIAEKIFQNSERRNDLDKWYKNLMLAVFEAIPRIGVEHPKTPHQVVKMGELHF